MAGGHLHALPTVRLPQVRSVEAWAETYGQHVGWVLAMQVGCNSSEALRATAENRATLVRGEIERGATYAAGRSFQEGLAAGRAWHAQDISGLDRDAKARACGRFPRIETRFVTTGEVFRWKR